MNTIQTKLIAVMQQLVAAYQKLITKPVIISTASQKIYDAAASCLHTHITLNEAVPPEVGCAEAVSYVLSKAGVYGIPLTGIAGTSQLYDWLLSSRNFVNTVSPVPGDVVISPTGYSTSASPHGHVGIVAKYGILSNDSDSGLFIEKYTQETWNKFFHDVEGFPVRYFHAI